MEGNLLNLQNMLNNSQSESSSLKSNESSNENDLMDENYKKDNLSNNKNKKLDDFINDDDRINYQTLTQRFINYNPNQIETKMNLQLKVGNFIGEKQNLSKILKNIFKNILEKNSQKKYNEILQELKNSNKKFYDNEFPPNINSLIKGYNKKPKSNKTLLQKKYNNIKWIRESTINKKTNMKIFGNNFTAEEIKIGELSNKSFISVLTALIDYPEIITKIFKTKQKTENGIFCTKICKNGFLKEIIIDDFFPHNKKDNKLYFTSNNKKRLWTQILEKSYAKSYGSYNNIDIKSVQGILRDLTYAPVITLDNSYDDLIYLLSDAYSKKWIIIGSSGDTEASKDLLREIGLNPEFEYPIIMVYELTFDDLRFGNQTLANTTFIDENYKLILKIRNLWSEIEWIGDWSSASSFWNDDLKIKLNYQENEPCFYMDLKDFKHYFSKIKICKYDENYFYKSIQVFQKENNYTLIRFKISDFQPHNEDEIAHCQIALIQEDTLEKNDFKISRMILSKLEIRNGKKIIEYIDGKMEQSSELILDKHLSEGEYLLYCELSNIKNEITYVVSIYSNERIEMNQEENELYPKILENIFISCAKIQNISINFSEEGAPNCKKYSNTTTSGFTYIYFENLEKDATLLEDVKYTKFEGLELLPPYKGTSYHIKLPSGKNEIILIKHLELNEYNLIFSYQSSIDFGRQSLIKLTREKGKIQKFRDQKTNELVDISVYIYKHTLGLCYYYENNTENKILKETINIEKNSNVEFVGEKKGTEQLTVNLEPKKNCFVELKGKNNLWKVHPSINYVIEEVPLKKSNKLSGDECKEESKNNFKCNI